MIIQGSNEPLRITYRNINDKPRSDISVSLRNETTEFKHWGPLDVLDEDEGMTFVCPIKQEESVEWPEGPCWVEIKWIDAWGNTLFSKIETEILYWGDSRVMELPYRR